MHFIKYKSYKSLIPLDILAQNLLQQPCGVHYSSLDASLTLFGYPTLEESMSKKSCANDARVLAKFDGITSIDISSRDTIMLGDFSKLEHKRSGNNVICTIVLTDIDGSKNKVSFYFTSCKILKKRNSSTKKGTPIRAGVKT